MEPVGIILLVLFLFIIVMGPIACVRMNARRNVAENVHNPEPRQMDTARRKLSTVTTSTILPRPNDVPTTDIEAPTRPSDFGEW
jgi:Na+-transporting methylmalonyl-CoA/oxaloacetate decarboxylase gamma subunit